MVCLPWVRNINNAPWLDQQTLWDRTISIRRLKVSNTIGNIGYVGAEQSLTSPAGETVLYTNIPASIQLASSGRTTKNVELPGDATQKAVWNIIIPATALSIYSVRDRDIVVDDEGYRYQVGSNAWDNGYKLSTIRLEA